MNRRRSPPVRDQGKSAFSQILDNLIDATPGALGAVLVDNLGEPVDYAGFLDPFDIKIAGACLQLELRKASDTLASACGATQQIVVRARKRSFIARNLLEGYMLVMVLSRCAGFGISPRAISQAELALKKEAGWELPKGQERWALAHVEAEAKNRRRPARVHLEGHWQAIEIMGSVVGLAKGEHGYRVRTVTGTELTLVRERLGRWFADDSVE